MAFVRRYEDQSEEFRASEKDARCSVVLTCALPGAFPRRPSPAGAIRNPPLPFFRRSGLKKKIRPNSL